MDSVSFFEALILHLQTESEDESYYRGREVTGKQGYQIRNKIASQGQQAIQERGEEKDGKEKNVN